MEYRPFWKEYLPTFDRFERKKDRQMIENQKNKTPENNIISSKFGWMTSVFVFSFIVNMLMLTGPLYMLQVYDRVLSSRSIDTLIALTLLMGLLFLFMGVFDYIRGRILTRYGLLWSQATQDYVHKSSLKYEESKVILSDGDTVSRSYAHPSKIGTLDIVWSPLFVMFLYMLHPLLAAVTLFGMVLSLIITGISILRTKPLEEGVQEKMKTAISLENNLTKNYSVLESLASWEIVRQKWIDSKNSWETHSLHQQDTQSVWSTITKTYRLFFQSAILGLGAYLAVTGNITPGAMIAGSILSGRALAPMDQILSGLPLLIKAYTSKKKIKSLLKGKGPDLQGQTPSLNTGTLDVSNAYFQIPGQKPIIANLNFKANPKDCVAIMGETGTGKSVIAKILTGAWPATNGTVSLDGFITANITETARAKYIGFTPQDSHLPEGVLMDILKGYDTHISDEAVFAITKKMGVHTILSSLPNGYETLIQNQGNQLPMTVRRITLLVQAFVGDKKLIVLDDPAAHLPPHLITSLKELITDFITAGGTLILITDNLDLLTTVTHIMVLDQGRTVAYGEALQVVDTYIKAIQEGTPNITVPFALRMAISRRKANTQGQIK
jgi:ATP-binding cassette subfamily C protein